MDESKPSPGLTKVYKALRKLSSTTRPELAEVTGLSLPAVGTIVDSLVDLKLVKLKDVELDGKRGRPAQQVIVCPEEYPIGAIDFSSPTTQIGLFDLFGRPMHLETGLPSLYLSEYSPDDSIGYIVKQLEKFNTARAFGVSVPGFVQDGYVSRSWLFQIDQRIALQKELEKRLNAPVLVENGVNAAAWGEFRKRKLKSTQTMMFLNYGQGIGAGLIIGGRLHHGAHGAAGELGMMPFGVEAFERWDSTNVDSYLDAIPVDFKSRSFTHRGDVFLVERAFDVLMQIASDLTDPFGLVLEKMASGDQKSREAIALFSRYITLMLAYSIRTIDPDIVVLQNAWPHTEELFFKPIQTYLTKFGIQANVSLSQIGKLAGLNGIALQTAENLEESFLKKAK